MAIKAVVLSFIVALASLAVSAQTAPTAAASPESAAPSRAGSISGRVVDENGQPLKDATVQIRTTDSKKTWTASTDREGQFEINGLEPADYYAHAWSPAYLFVRATSPGSGNAYHIGDRITFTFAKGGVISGRVIDANGNPVVLVNVRAEMLRDTGGGVVNGWGDTRTTDDRGVYRIYGLRPGTYVVFAGGPGRASGPFSENLFAADVPTYAPSADRATASEITISPGEEANDVDIRYRAEKGRVISGEVTVPAGFPNFSVMLTTAGGAETQRAETFLKPPDKRIFVFNGVSDGDYGVIAQAFGSDGELAISEPRQVTVQGKDVTEVRLVTKLLGSVTGRLLLEETKAAECSIKESPLTTETFVFATPRDNDAAKQIPRTIWSRGAPVRPNEKGEFVLRNLAPGDYYFGSRFNARQWYLHSITLGAATNPAAKVKPVDATRVWTNIKIGDSLSGLTITLAQGGATLLGELPLSQAESAPGRTFLYLVPAESENVNNVLRFFATPVAPNGTFELNNIAPGRYRVLVRTGGENPAAFSAKLRLPHETETRAQLRREAEAAKTEIEFKPCQNILDFKLPQKPLAQ